MRFFIIIVSVILVSSSQAICQKIDFQLPQNLSMDIGGTFQVDYRNISDQGRADSRFDIRRARLRIKGDHLSYLTYKLECELQGNENKRLVDAYGIFEMHPSLKIQLGQFKTPFSHEWLMDDVSFPFAERSIGFSLQPGRDVGMMIGGELFNQLLEYRIGAFNGDGTDGSSRGSQKDEPEFISRLVINPFALMNIKYFSQFFAFSFTESRIDTTNIQIKAKSTGMIGTQRSLYTLTANTKFGALLDINKRRRKCLESGLIWGPVAFFAEYQRFQYTDLEAVRIEKGNASFFSWYASFIVNLDGSPINFKSSRQEKSSIWQAAFRREHFSGDANWILDKSFNSVKETDAYSLALSWINMPYYRLMADYTYTELSDPIRIRINPDGTTEYISSETSVTIRFQVNF